MHPVVTSLDSLGGIASLQQLHGPRHGDAAIRAARDRGEIRRLRRGWYASSTADPRVAAAVTVGGRLGCLSACAALGIWEPPFAGLHIAVARGANHLVIPSPDDELAWGGVRLHWMAKRSTRLTEPQPLLEALATAFTCQPEEYAFAMLESAMRLGLVTNSDKPKLKRKVATRFWPTVDFADGVAESGSESVFKFRAHRDGFALRQQVSFLGLARVDFTLGDRHLIEIDSEKHHGSAAQRLRDLKRDAWLAGFGACTLRFDYSMVLWDWELVSAALSGALRSER